MVQIKFEEGYAALWQKSLPHALASAPFSQPASHPVSTATTVTVR
jgi:hypothetical protein